MFSVTLGMIIPFISIYTRGVTDIDYNRPLFGYLLLWHLIFQLGSHIRMLLRQLDITNKQNDIHILKQL